MDLTGDFSCLLEGCGEDEDRLFSVVLGAEGRVATDPGEIPARQKEKTVLMRQLRQSTGAQRDCGVVVLEGEQTVRIWAQVRPTFHKILQDLLQLQEFQAQWLSLVLDPPQILLPGSC